MRGRAFTLLLAWVTLAPANARAETPRTHGGVSLAELDPAGLIRTHVAAPSSPGQPVRLTYRDDQRVVVLLLDVRIAADDAEARLTLDRWVHGLAREPERRDDLGDGGVAAPGLRAFTRDNVMVALRTFGDAVDVETEAARILAVVARSPRGATSANAPRIPALTAQGAARIRFPGAIASRLSAHGPAVVRRTADGYRVARSGPRAFDLEVVVVDDRLRVARVVVSR